MLFQVSRTNKLVLCQVYMLGVEQAIKQELSLAPASFRTLCNLHYCQDIEIIFQKSHIHKPCFCVLILKWHQSERQ